MLETATLIGAAGFAVLIVATMRSDRVVGVALIGLMALALLQSEGSPTLIAGMVALSVLATVRRPEVLDLSGLGPLTAPLLLLFGVLASATWAHQPAGGWNFFALLATSLLSALLLTRAANDHERAAVMTWLVRLGVIAALYAVFEVAGVFPVLGDAGVTSTNQIFSGLSRAQATMGHPLPLAFFLLVALLVAARQTSRSGAARIFVLAALVAGLLATGSRSALAVGVLVGIVVLGRRVNVPRALLVGAFGFCLALAFGVFQGELVQRFLSSNSLSHRLGAFESVPGLLEMQGGGEVWLGNGVFSAPGLFQRGLLQRGEFFAVDNQYVTTLVEGGLIGVLALAWLLVAGFRRTDVTGRLLIVASAAMFLSFDLLFYASATVMLGLALGRQSQSPVATPPPVAHATARSLQ